MLVVKFIVISLWNLREDYGYCWRQLSRHLVGFYLAACIKASNTGEFKKERKKTQIFSSCCI